MSESTNTETIREAVGSLDADLFRSMAKNFAGFKIIQARHLAGNDIVIMMGPEAYRKLIDQALNFSGSGPSATKDMTDTASEEAS